MPGVEMILLGDTMGYLINKQSSLGWARSVFLFFVLLLVTSVIGINQAEAAPAKYVGKLQTCDSIHPGAFLDVGTGKCYTCPDTHPERTVMSVEGPQACEKPAHTKFKKALGPKPPTGLLKTDCADGWFYDIGKRKCYSCDGWNRTASSVTSAKACSKNYKLTRSKATDRGDFKLCPDGAFRHRLGESCYACPAGTYRNANLNPSGANACTACGGVGAKPCPITTLRKSCDAGLEEDFLKGVCVYSKSEILRRDAEKRMKALSAEFEGVIRQAVMFERDPEFMRGLEAKTPTSTHYVKSKTDAAVNPCIGDENQTWTLGVIGGFGAGIHFNGEVGVAVDVSVAGRSGSQRPAYAFLGGEVAIAAAYGVNGGLNYGCWTAPNNAISGNYHGISIDLVELSKKASGYEFSTTIEPDVVIAFWYNPDSKTIDPAKDYLGWTVSIAASKGKDLTGFSYSRGSTGQITGAFPPPLGNDRIFGDLYEFRSDTSKRNEFYMQGPNQVSVRAAPDGQMQVYLRSGLSPNVFKAQNGEATYTIEDNASLTWRRRPNDPNPVILDRVMP